MNETAHNDTPAGYCLRCGTQVAPEVLVCPSCHALIHASRLKQLAAEAETASSTQDWSVALGAWREALELLPAGTKQRDSVAEHIAALSERVEKGGAAAVPSQHKSGVGKRAAGLGVISAVLLKFKSVLLLLVTKGKLLLLGLSKGSTVLSMLLSLGVYWTAFGWKFATGLVLSIYVHEMGHIAVLRRYGIKSTAPMFIPGFGAMVRLQQYPQDPREDARVGLAGPTWGLAAVLFAWVVHLATGWQSWAAIARVGAWINLFNLIPVWQLDGSRGFSSLVRPHRWIAVGAIAAAWFLSRESLLVLLLIAAMIRAFGTKLPDRSDHAVLAQYCALVLVLAWMTTISVATISG